MMTSNKRSRCLWRKRRKENRSYLLQLFMSTLAFSHRRFEGSALVHTHILIFYSRINRWNPWPGCPCVVCCTEDWNSKTWTLITDDWEGGKQSVCGHFSSIRNEAIRIILDWRCPFFFITTRIIHGNAQLDFMEQLPHHKPKVKEKRSWLFLQQKASKC